MNETKYVSANFGVVIFCELRNATSTYGRVATISELTECLQRFNGDSTSQ